MNIEDKDTLTKCIFCDAPVKNSRLEKHIKNAHKNFVLIQKRDGKILWKQDATDSHLNY